jgi:hypothetical protein
MDSKGVKPLVLKGYGGNNMVRRGMINQVFRKYPNIRYGHIYAHGNYKTDGAGIFGIDVPRTRLLFNDGEWVAFNSRKWTDKGVAVPAGYQWLSDTLEKAHYLNQIPFPAGQLKILVLESCYALRNVATMDGDGLVYYVDGAYEYEWTHNHLPYYPGYPYTDVCFGLNILNDNQIAIGSADAVIGGFYPYWRRFFNTFWRALGDGYNVQMSLEEALDWSGIPYAVLWGYRIRGAGETLFIYLSQ